MQKTVTKDKRQSDVSKWLFRKYKEYRVGTLMILPFLVLFLLFTIIPVIISIGISMTNYDMLQAPEWVWLDNYKNLFMDDDIFSIAISNTLVIALIAGPVGYLGSFFMAWYLNQLKGRNLFAICFYAPSITSGVAMSVVWLYLFSGDRYGLVNNLLMNMGIINTPVVWNQNTDTILPIIILIQIWMSMGTGFLVFLAGLQNENKELLEAGQIDGIRNKWQELWLITLPQMKPQLLFGAINAVVGVFSVFDVAMSFAGFPSPNYAAHTIVAHLYDYAFLRYEMGYASAISFILFVITFLIGQVLMRALSGHDE